MPEAFGAEGVQVAQLICQQALNRTQGGVVARGVGFPGGVFHADISGFEACDDRLYAALSLQLVNTDVLDVWRRKLTLLVLSGCERHPVELLQPLLLRVLKDIGAAFICAVGSTACLD